MNTLGIFEAISKYLAFYIQDIESQRERIAGIDTVNHSEKELLNLLDKRLKTILEDLYVTQDYLYEIEFCDNDYNSLAYLLELQKGAIESGF